MKILLYNLAISCIGSLAFLPLWYLHRTKAPSIQVLFDLIALPLILCIFNLVMFFKGYIPSFKMLYWIIPLSCIMAGCVAYFNWGISTGLLLKPDAETVMLMKWFLSLSAVIPLLLWGIIHLILHVTNITNSKLEV